MDKLFVTRITVTLPTEQVEELRRLTNDVSGFVAEAVARQIQHQLLADNLRRCRDEQGAFTAEEMSEASARTSGSAGSAG
ncbi:hypothetical protein [Kitasatospora paracochleata]|uniref:Post-segregation antitoxin (Ccd killing protein) n=1 Tax=Kitasatospora paracochleata TaxID=58354 RepID=A0ABT1J758_9ACTN|nr:hypothetical protein [Kitasatospora paracochleata]MCP2313272.1 post-segregation antitoxin (ccd killing protein) [Kitasatospora paracochleata]